MCFCTRLLTVWLVFLIVQTSATYFNEFQGSDFDVHNSIGKLITNVVSDVEQNIDCAVEEIENVLNPDKFSLYNRLCAPQSAHMNPSTQKQIIPPIVTIKDAKKVDKYFAQNNHSLPMQRINEPLLGLIKRESQNKYNNMGRVFFNKSYSSGSMTEDENEQLKKTYNKEKSFDLLTDYELSHKLESNENNTAQNSKLLHGNNNYSIVNFTIPAKEDMNDMVKKLKKSNKALPDIDKRLKQGQKEESKELRDLNNMHESVNAPDYVKYTIYNKIHSKNNLNYTDPIIITSTISTTENALLLNTTISNTVGNNTTETEIYKPKHIARESPNNYVSYKANTSKFSTKGNNINISTPIKSITKNKSHLSNAYYNILLPKKRINGAIFGVTKSLNKKPVDKEALTNTTEILPIVITAAPEYVDGKNDVHYKAESIKKESAYDVDDVDDILELIREGKKSHIIMNSILKNENEAVEVFDNTDLFPFG